MILKKVLLYTRAIFCQLNVLGQNIIRKTFTFPGLESTFIVGTLILDPLSEQNHVCVWVRYGTLSAVKEVYCRDRFLPGGCEIPKESPLSMEELLRRGNVSEGDRQRRSAQY